MSRFGAGVGASTVTRNKFLSSWCCWNGLHSGSVGVGSCRGRGRDEIRRGNGSGVEGRGWRELGRSARTPRPTPRASSAQQANPRPEGETAKANCSIIKSFITALRCAGTPTGRLSGAGRPGESRTGSHYGESALWARVEAARRRGGAGWGTASAAALPG